MAILFSSGWGWHWKWIETCTATIWSTCLQRLPARVVSQTKLGTPPSWALCVSFSRGFCLVILSRYLLLAKEVEKSQTDVCFIEKIACDFAETQFLYMAITSITICHRVLLSAKKQLNLPSNWWSFINCKDKTDIPASGYYCITNVLEISYQKAR